jgi:hypothetical protein
MRAATAVITFWVGAAVMLVVVGIPLVQADWSLFWSLLPPALFLAWLFWIVLYRPAVHYDRAGAIVINIGRKHVLPWSHVTHLRQGIGLRFELDTGTTVQAWGVPPPRRTGIIAGAIDRRTRPTQDFHHDADVLDAMRASAPKGSEPVMSTWETVPLVIGAVLVGALVLEFAFRL